MKLFLAMMLAMGAGALLVASATKAAKGAAQKTESAVKSTVDHTESLVADRIGRWVDAVAAGWDELEEKLVTAQAPVPFMGSQAGPDESVVPPPPVIAPWSAPRRPLYVPWALGGRAVPRRARGRYFEK